MPLLYAFSPSTPVSFHFKVSNSSSLASLAADFDAPSFAWANVKPFGILNHCVMPRHGKTTCGRILAHAKNQIQAFRELMGLRVCVFKVGITCNPIRRFISYQELGFTDMWVVTQSDSVDLISMLEAACVALFSAHVGCRNKAETGGEGALNRSPPPNHLFSCTSQVDVLTSIERSAESFVLPIGRKKHAIVRSCLPKCLLQALPLHPTFLSKHLVQHSTSE